MLPPTRFLVSPAPPCTSADPDWVRPVLAKALPADGGPQPMRVVVYDADRRSSTPDALSLGSQDYLGEAEFMMAELMAAPGGTLELPLLDLEVRRGDWEGRRGA